MSIAVVLLIAAFILFVIEAWLRKSLLAAGLACWVLAVVLGAAHFVAAAQPHLVAYLAAAPAAAPAVPIDAATLASIILGVVLLPILKLVPLKDNAMIAVTWGATFVAALAAVVVVDQLQGIAFSWARLLVDVGLAYAIQAGAFTATKHNAPALVT